MSYASDAVGRDAELARVMTVLEEPRWCAVVAPRYSGKTVFAHQVQKRVAEQHPAWKTGHITFSDCATLEQVWKQIREKAGFEERNAVVGRGLDIPAQFQAALGNGGVTHCFLLDNLDELPDEVTRELCGELRRLWNSSQFHNLRGPIRLVLFGAMALHYQTAGELSPLWNVVQRLDLPDLSAEQAGELLGKKLPAATLTDAARQALHSETAGHPYLVTVIASQLEANKEAAVTAKLIRSVAADWSSRCSKLEGTTDPCFLEIVRYLERHSRAFTVVRRLLDAHKPQPQPLGLNDIALMCAGLAQHGERFVFRGEMMKRALDGYLDKLRRADHCCLHDDWDSARKYYGDVNRKDVHKRRANGSGHSNKTIIDLYLGLSPTSSRYRHLAEAEHFVLETGRKFFGAGRAVLWDSEDAGQSIQLHKQTGSGQCAKELARQAAKHLCTFTLGGNRGVMLGIGQHDDPHRWALELIYDQGTPGTWVEENLRQVEPSLHSILSQARRRELESTRQTQQRQLIHDVVLQIQQATQIQTVLRQITTGVVNPLGYECAQLSLVFPEEGLIRAVEANGAFELIKPQTSRDLHGGDILAEVIRGKEPRMVDDCRKKEHHCDLDAISEAQLRSQVVVPLIIGNETIGTLQVGNTKLVNAFNSADVTVLLLFADAAAVAIRMAQERETLELALSAVGDAMVAVDVQGRVSSCNLAYAELFPVQVGAAAPLTRAESTVGSPPLVRVAFERKQPLQTLREIQGRRYIVTAAGKIDAFGRYAGGVEVIGTRNPLYGLTETLSRILAIEDETALGQAVVDCLHDHLGYARVRFYVTNPTGTRMAPGWCCGMVPATSFLSPGLETDRALDSRAGDGFECLRQAMPLIVVPKSRDKEALPEHEVTLDSQHRRILCLPDEECRFYDRLDKSGVVEWMDVPIGSEANPIGKLSIDQKGRDSRFGLEDLELMSLFSGWASAAMNRVRELDRARKIAEAADEVRHLGDRAGMDEVGWHFLYQITMHGGPGMNRAAIFIKRAPSEQIAGFLCHGAAGVVEFAAVCKEKLVGERAQLIDDLVAGKLKGAMTQAEQERVSRFRRYAIGAADPGPFGRVLRSLRSEIVTMPAQELAEFYALLGWEPARSALLCPLVIQGECEGLIYADRAFLVAGVDRPGERDLMEGMAVHLAAAARSARRAEQLRHQILGLSHASKAPMITARLLSDEAKKSELNPRTLNYLCLIGALTRLGEHQMQRLMTFTKLSSGTLKIDRQMTLVDQLIANRVEPHRVLLDDMGVQTSFLFECAAPCRVDADLLGLVFEELTANARKAIEDCEELGERYLAISSKPGPGQGEIAVSFENTGRPVPAHLKDTMFDLFSSATGSSGIGLHLVREIVVMHGGTIVYADKENGISKFTVTLPCGLEGDPNCQ